MVGGPELADEFHGDTVSWLGRDFDPNAFDLDRVDEGMKRLARQPNRLRQGVRMRRRARASRIGSRSSEAERDHA